MKWNKVLVILLLIIPILMMLFGCQTPGRITLAEINSLEAAQMRALAESDALVYGSDRETAARAADVSGDTKSGVPWLEAVKAAISAKWRVTLIKIEWGRPYGPTPWGRPAPKNKETK